MKSSKMIEKHYHDVTWLSIRTCDAKDSLNCSFFLQGIQMSFYKGSMMSTQRNGSSIILQHSGRSWPVKFCVNDKQPPRFTSGWGDFVKDNAIKLGEVCVFELIESNVMKVSIFRC